MRTGLSNETRHVVLCMCSRKVMAAKQRQCLLTTWVRRIEQDPQMSNHSDDDLASIPKRSCSVQSDSGDEDQQAESQRDTGIMITGTRYDPRLVQRDRSDTRFESCRQPYDIGVIAEFARHLNREEKFKALHNISKPPQSYVFPQHTEGTHNHQRSFQQKWLKEYTWLAYSKEKNGGYCVPCVLSCKNHERLGKLVNSPLNKFKDAVETLRQHSKKVYHTHSVSDMITFMQIMENKQLPIDHQLVSALAQQVQRNRELLKSIIKTVIFCGKQNIALRGHRDDFQDLAQPGNHGNFHALVKFRIDSGDEKLQTHLENARRNARYM